MKMLPVDSSNLEAVGYEQGTLRVAFRNGTEYEYFSVPEFVFESLLAASSKGQYHHRHVKGVYDYRRVI